MGPPYMKLSTKVLYSLENIKKFEEQNTHYPTNQKPLRSKTKEGLVAKSQNNFLQCSRVFDSSEQCLVVFQLIQQCYRVFDKTGNCVVLCSNLRVSCSTQQCWRRKRDSNPRYSFTRILSQQESAFDHSAISPLGNLGIFKRDVNIVDLKRGGDNRNKEMILQEPIGLQWVCKVFALNAAKHFTQMGKTQEKHFASLNVKTQSE